MPQLTWQKSSFSGGESEACLYLATAPDGTLRLRESDAPDEIITTTRTLLDHLIRTVKSGGLPDSGRVGR